MKYYILLIISLLLLVGCETTSQKYNAISKNDYTWTELSETEIKVQVEREVQISKPVDLKLMLDNFAKKASEGRRYEIVYGPVEKLIRNPQSGVISGGIYVPLSGPSYEVYIQEAKIKLLEGSGFNMKQYSLTKQIKTGGR